MKFAREIFRCTSQLIVSLVNGWICPKKIADPGKSMPGFRGRYQLPAGWSCTAGTKLVLPGRYYLPRSRATEYSNSLVKFVCLTSQTPPTQRRVIAAT